MLKGSRGSAERPMRGRVTAMCVRVLAAVSLAALAGCSKNEQPETSRADDPEYQKALNDAMAAKSSLQSALAKARDAYEAAKAADSEGERTKELEAKVKECAAAVEAQRKASVEMVRNRIWKDIGESEKKEPAKK